MEASKLRIFVSKSWNRVLIDRVRVHSPRIGEYFIVVSIKEKEKKMSGQITNDECHSSISVLAQRTKVPSQ
jgi:hypothetical protein